MRCGHEQFAVYYFRQTQINGEERIAEMWVGRVESDVALVLGLFILLSSSYDINTYLLLRPLRACRGQSPHRAHPGRRAAQIDHRRLAAPGSKRERRSWSEYLKVTYSIFYVLFFFIVQV